MNPFEFAVDRSHLWYNFNNVSFPGLLLILKSCKLLSLKNWTFDLVSVSGMDGAHY